jgi:hypothetical protein
LKPCKTPKASGDSPPPSRNTNASPTSPSAEGSVKPTHAASAPSHPARRSPTSKPSWLDAGPGTNWHSATNPAKSSRDSHLRRST